MRNPWITALVVSFGAVTLAMLAAQERPVSAAQPTPVSAAQPTPVTFSKNVLPLLQKHCRTCHGPGEIAPMSFLTYESTRKKQTVRSAGAA